MTAIVLMGVAGCGKSTLGVELARVLGRPLIEGDAFHPAANVAKMRAGIPLDDADRYGWLAALGRELRRHPDGALLACSALKKIYRDQLREAAPGLLFVYLELSPEDARRRLEIRAEKHFFQANLVTSQFEALEPPLAEPGVLALDATLPLAELTQRVREWLNAGAQ